MVTFDRLQWAWVLLCALGVVVLGSMGEDAEAECRAEGGWFCFPAGMVFGLVAVSGLVVWVIGALLIWLMSKLVRWWRSA